MLKNYTKIAIRTIVRHKGYSFINVVGARHCYDLLSAHFNVGAGWIQLTSNFRILTLASSTTIIVPDISSVVSSKSCSQTRITF